MSNLFKDYNVYCDESRVENPDSQFMVIGAVLIPREQKIRIAKELKEIVFTYNFHQEIKWNKVGERYKEFYKRIIDYFLSNKSLQFRCIVVDKKTVNYDIFHNKDKELAFFKFYYLMLKNKLDDNNQYYILLDKKPTRDKKRARSLKSFLDSYVLLHRSNCNIKHLQAYNLRDNVLIQLADFLTGLVAYRNNTILKNNTKSSIAKYLEEKANTKLIKTTPAFSLKLNILKWTPKP